MYMFLNQNPTLYEIPDYMLVPIQQLWHKAHFHLWKLEIQHRTLVINSINISQCLAIRNTYCGSQVVLTEWKVLLRKRKERQKLERITDKRDRQTGGQKEETNNLWSFKSSRMSVTRAHHFSFLLDGILHSKSYILQKTPWKLDMSLQSYYQKVVKTIENKWTYFLCLALQINVLEFRLILLDRTTFVSFCAFYSILHILYCKPKISTCDLKTLPTQILPNLTRNFGDEIQHMKYAIIKNSEAYLLQDTRSKIKGWNFRVTLQNFRVTAKICYKISRQIPFTRHQIWNYGVRFQVATQIYKCDTKWYK